MKRLGQAADEFDGFAVVVEHVPFVVVRPFAAGQPNVDGLVQRWQLLSALDMVHIFCIGKKKRNSMFRFDDEKKKHDLSVLCVCVLVLLVLREKTFAWSWSTMC